MSLQKLSNGSPLMAAHERLSQCHICNARMSRPGDLPRHMQTHDTAAKRYHCFFPRCKYSALQKRNFLNHVFTHTQERPYRCAFCFYTTGDSASIARHHREKHNYRRHRPERGITNIRRQAVDWEALRNGTWNAVKIPVLESWFQRIDITHATEFPNISSKGAHTVSLPDDDDISADGDDESDDERSERQEGREEEATLDSASKASSEIEQPAAYNAARAVVSVASGPPSLSFSTKFAQGERHVAHVPSKGCDGPLKDKGPSGVSRMGSIVFDVRNHARHRYEDRPSPSVATARYRLCTRPRISACASSSNIPESCTVSPFFSAVVEDSTNVNKGVRGVSIKDRISIPNLLNPAT